MFLNNYAHSQLMCAYCESLLDESFCWDCNEYKGVMTVADFQTIFGEDY